MVRAPSSGLQELALGELRLRLGQFSVDCTLSMKSLFSWMTVPSITVIVVIVVIIITIITIIMYLRPQLASSDSSPQSLSVSQTYGYGIQRRLSQVNWCGEQVGGGAKQATM